MGQQLSRRYAKEFDDAVEEMPLNRRAELHHELQRQVSQLGRLEEEIVQSLKIIDTDEAELENTEHFLKLRRKSYMKQLGLWDEIEPEDDNSDEESQHRMDDPVGERENEVQDTRAHHSSTVLPQRTAGNQLGSIEVKGPHDEDKEAKIRTFLERELPAIQTNVALNARTLGWKRERFQNKLDETQDKIKEIQDMLQTLGPSLPFVESSLAENPNPQV